jgi:alpha-ketoglutarate-dependent 2,4-dichlorophenoxyacetate dioxygenase
MTKPLTAAEVGATHPGMDKYGVPVFHDQHIDDEQQLAFMYCACRTRTRTLS